MRCPKCREILTMVESQGIRYRQCTSCFGCCVGEVALKRLARMEALKAQTPASPDAPAAADPADASIADLAVLVAESDTKKELRCPVCQAVMRKDRVHPMVPVQIDICPKCKTGWLDAGEMRLIQKLYAELQNSTDPRIVKLRDKIAGVNLQLENRRQERSDIETQVNSVATDIGMLIRMWAGR